MSYALKTAGASTVTMLTAVAIGLLCVQALAAAAPNRSGGAFVVVTSFTHDELQVWKANPRTLERTSPVLSLPVVAEPATRPRFPGTWALSRDRQLLAISVERDLSRMELEVIDLGQMKLLRSLRTALQPIVWPSAHRLVGSDSAGSLARYIAIDPATGATVETIARPGWPISGGQTLVRTGVLGGPVRVLRLDMPAAFRVVTFPRLRTGIEPFLGGAGRLPPEAKIAVARARSAARGNGPARLTAVAPFEYGNTTFGCVEGAGFQVITRGYRVVFRQAGQQVEYRVMNGYPPLLCDPAHTGPLRPDANMLTAPRPTWYVTSPEFTLDRAGGLVALAGSAVARRSVDPVRIRYRTLRPRARFVDPPLAVGARSVATGIEEEAALVDTQTGRSRVFGAGTPVAVSGGNILVLDDGLDVYDRTGHLRSTALRAGIRQLQVFGDYVYAFVEGDPRRLRVLSLRTGRVVAHVRESGSLLLPARP